MPVVNVTPVRKAMPVANAPKAVPAPPAPQPVVINDSLVITSPRAEAKIKGVADKLKAAMAAHDAIRGYHTAWGWREYSRRNVQALEDALGTLKADPELAVRCHVTVMVLESWLALNDMTTAQGQYGAGGWREFADANRRTLGTALSSLSIRT